MTPGKEIFSFIGFSILSNKATLYTYKFSQTATVAPKKWLIKMHQEAFKLRKCQYIYSLFYTLSFHQNPILSTYIKYLSHLVIVIVQS